MAKIDYGMIRLIDDIVPTTTPSGVRHCKPEECPQYGHAKGLPGKFCKRHAHNPRVVQYGQECLDLLPPSR